MERGQGCARAGLRLAEGTAGVFLTRPKSTHAAAALRGGVAGRVFADPAFVRGFVGELVAGVGGKAEAVGLVVETAVNERHVEDDGVAQTKFGRGEPAAAETFGALAHVGKAEALLRIPDQATADKLIADGLAPDVPVAVVENATRPAMRVLRSPLAGLGELVTRNKVKSPALIVIGEVAAEPADEPLKTLALEALQ